LIRSFVLRQRYAILLIFGITAIIAVNLHPAALLRDFLRQHPALELRHIDDIFLSIIIIFIPLILISVWQLKKSYLSEYQLGKCRALHQDLLENLPIAVAEFDASQHIKITNHAFNRLNQQIGEETLNAQIKQLSDTLHSSENTTDVVLKQNHQDTNNISNVCIEWYLHQRPDNTYLLLARDISQQQDALDKLAISQRILENTPIGVMVVNASTKIEYTNAAFEKITGYSCDEASGQNPAMLQSGRHEKEFYSAMYDSLDKNGHWQGEIWNRRKNGEIYPQWLSLTSLKDGNDEITHYIGMFSEITAHEHVQEQLRTLAYYDGLTSLPNRTLFNDELHRLIRNPSHKNLCVIFIDMDGFNRINDSFGHKVGDQLLTAFAERLKQNVRHGDVIARWGGDEFIVAIEVSDFHYGISNFCKKQLKAISQPFSLSGREWNITASIGVSVFGNDAKNADELVRNADMAMNQAKRHGKNCYEIFSTKLHEEISESIEIENRLRIAIRKQEIDVHFQPQIDTASHKVHGFEALARWSDSQLGDVPPLKFIKVAEDTGLINSLSELIISKAFAHLLHWHTINPNLVLSVNLSASQLQGDELIPFLRKTAHSFSLDPQKIKLEITEDVFMSDIKKAVHTTSQLKQLGFQISLDDFGTGYSSLSYLQDFDIDELKIDRSFVQNIHTSERNKAIVAAIVAMAKILGIDCIVEGVEAEAQLIELQNMGCSLFQGYLYHKPMPAKDIDQLLLSFSTEKNAKLALIS